MSQGAQFCVLDQSNIDQILDLILQANLHNLPKLMHIYQNIQSYHTSNLKILQVIFQSERYLQQNLSKPPQFCHGLRVNTQLIAIILAQDLRIQYNKILKQKDNIYWRQFLSLNIENIPIGQAVYFTRLGVHPQFVGKKYGKRMIAESSAYLLQKGYKYSVSAVIDKKPLHMFISLDGQLLSHNELQKENELFTIDLIRNDFKRCGAVWGKIKQGIKI